LKGSAKEGSRESEDGVTVGDGGGVDIGLLLEGLTMESDAGGGSEN